MERRDILGVIGSAGLVGFAGCMTSSEDNDSPDSSEPSTSDSNSPEDSSTGNTDEIQSPTVEWENVAGATIGNGHHFPSPRLVDGTLIVVSGLNDAGTVEGYNPENGDREWELSVGTSMTSAHPLPTDNSIIVCKSDSGLQAISSSGDVEWDEEISVYGDPLAVDDTIYVPTYKGIEARGFDGTQFWTWDSETSVNYVGASDDGTVYTKARTSLYAIDATEGVTQWEMRTSMELSTPPVTIDGLLILGQENGQVTALSTETQEEEWSINLNNGISTPITTGESTIYASGWSYPVHALNPEDGTTKWDIDMQYQPLSPALESGDTVYVGSDTGTLSARAKSDGSPKWSYEAGSDIWAPPTIEGDRIYLATESGAIICLTTSE